MSHARVCSVVVTFHPGDVLVGGLREMRAQSQGMVLVDNGSDAEELAVLRQASRDLDFRLIEAGENLGIAAAQNLGIAWAQAEQFDFVLFFDQDSAIPAAFVETLVDFFETEAHSHRVAIVVPRYRDSRLGHLLDAPHTPDGDLELAMSSGALIPIPVFDRLGNFEDSLFIDYVDYEFSLRARSAGYSLSECPTAILQHAPADPQRSKLFGLLGVTSANYGPFRRYFLARNLVWMLRNYGLQFPAINLQFLLNFFKDSAKVLLVESDSWSKTAASLRGLADGLRNRMGKGPAATRARSAGA